MRILRNLAFVVLVLVSLFFSERRTRAVAEDCYFSGYSGPNELCETTLTDVCYQLGNDPGGYICAQDFEDTCQAYCGTDNVVGGDCEWSGSPYSGSSPI